MITEDDVLYEDNHLIAINKKSGILVQGDITGDRPLSDLTKDFLVKKYNKTGEAYLGVPHRLDRPTSGLVLFAKTSKALPRLNKLFESKLIQKTYWAIVKNRPPKQSDTLVNYLVRNNQKNKSFVTTENNKQAKKAELSYKVIQQMDKYFLLEIKPKTGRHHQIRVQLANIGCPIRGDLKYGFERSNRDASIHLHAKSVEFIHPVKKEPIKITAAPSSEDSLWKESLKSL